jgi:hypothetical protein
MLRTAIALIVLLAPLSPAAAQPDVQKALAEVRARLMGPAEFWQPRAVWLSGPGSANQMDLTVTLRFDDHGRYLTSGRGVISIAFGFDGTSTWNQDATGITRTLELGDGDRTRLGQWIMSGYWAHPAAPVEVFESDVRAGRDQMALTVRLTGSRVYGTLILNTREWLPREFITRFSGSDQVVRFVEFETLDGRAVVKEVRVETNGRETFHVVFDEIRVDTVAGEEAFVAPRSRDSVSYSGDGGLIENQRGRLGHHFVRPIINGREVGWFAFDTGAGGTSVDRDIARELGLPTIGVGQATGVGGQRGVTIHTTTSFQIGPVRIEGMPVSGAETSGLPLGLPDGYDGLLGMDVLSHCVIDYDQLNSRIGLYDPNTYELPRGEWQPLLAYNRKPTVRMEYEEYTGMFTIDTGNPGAIIIGAMAVARNDLLDGRTTESGFVEGIGGSVASEDGLLDWVVWGGRKFNDVPAEFVVENRGVTADETRDGVIGTDLLERYRVIFDMTHGRIAFLPN